MSAAPKIPDALLSDVVAHYQKGWSLRRIAEWLTAEKQLEVSRTAVSGAIVRAGVPEPEALQDVWAELVEEAPANLLRLNTLQVEREEVLCSVTDKSLKREDALLMMKLIAQQERTLLWKLRVAGVRTPPQPSPASTERSEPTRPVTIPAASAPVIQPAAPPSSVRRAVPAVSRNAPCPCGSNQKYKKCCGLNPPTAVTNAVTDRVSQMTA